MNVYRKSVRKESQILGISIFIILVNAKLQSNFSFTLQTSIKVKYLLLFVQNVVQGILPCTNVTARLKKFTQEKFGWCQLCESGFGPLR